MKEFLAKLLISTIAVLSPVTPLLLTVGIMIGLDTIIGIFRSIKKKVPVKSKLLWTGLIQKIAITSSSVFSVYLMDKYLIQSGLHLERIVATIICLTEAKSISESLEILYGYNIWGTMKKILMRGSNTAKDIFEKEK
jgi:hypothetical protein